MTVEIIFEYHSTSTDNEAGIASGWRDPPLSPTGREQAKELGERRRGEPIDAIFCSDLKRAVETAEIAFGATAALHPDRRLRDVAERVHSFLDDLTGDFNGKRVVIIGHGATKLALDHLLGGMSVDDATAQPFIQQSTPPSGRYILEP